MKTKKPVKLCHFVLCKGIDTDIKQFADQLAIVKDKINEGLDFDVEFLVSNEEIKLTDLDELITTLTELQKKYNDSRFKRLDKYYKPEGE